MTVSESFLTTRRRVLKLLAMMGLGGSELARAAAAIAKTDELPTLAWPEMTYRTLGRTGFRGSRLVFGCGAALIFWERNELLDRALEHGVNVFDVGTSEYYQYAEANLAPFAKRHRDEIFLISKGLVGLDVTPSDELTSEQRETAARNWAAALDQSLTA